MKGLYKFDTYILDPARRLLLRGDDVVGIPAKAFDTLLVLVEHQGEVVSKDDLMKAVWPDSFVEEGNLSQSIYTLRKALGEGVAEHRYIVTVPGRGYRFVPNVIKSSKSDEAESAQPSSDVGPQPSPRSFWWRKRRVIAAGLGTIVIAAIAVSLRPTPPKLTDRDTIVLADFHNTTGDAVFDDTLKQGLSISLNQSPFLNVLSDARVAETLQLMSRPVGTQLTPGVTRELCQRAGSKAYIEGSIASLGSQYVLGLQAVNCQTGDILAQQQATAAVKEKVLDAMGKAAARLRGELGESLATVQKFNVPLEQATTPSLEALKAYTLGRKATSAEMAGARAYLQRAVQLDPNFAMGYWGLGQDYLYHAESARSSEYFTKAFELRERAGEREKLAITSAYYRNVTGELEKAAHIYQEWIESYPRDRGGHIYLGNVYAELGQYEKARDALFEYFRYPDNPDDGPLCYPLLALQQFDEARQRIQQAQAGKLDKTDFHSCLYAMVFLRTDSSAMAEQQQWFARSPATENIGLSLASDTAAYAGHLREARELTRRSIPSAIRADDIENGAIWEDNGALREAAFGNAAEAKHAASEALNIAPDNKDVSVEAALAFAMAGDAARAQSLARDLNERYPLDTQVQSLWLPAIQAQLALNRNNPNDALKLLQAAVSVELGNIHWIVPNSCLYPTYIRAEAYLAAGQGNAAAVEFQKIVDHSGIVWNCWTGALARLGVARANALQAKTLRGAGADAARVRALAAYKDFLTLWQDADPGIPILRQAKAEYAKLQRGQHSQMRRRVQALNKLQEIYSGKPTQSPGLSCRAALENRTVTQLRLCFKADRTQGFGEEMYNLSRFSA